MKQNCKNLPLKLFISDRATDSSELESDSDLEPSVCNDDEPGSNYLKKILCVRYKEIKHLILVKAVKGFPFVNLNVQCAYNRA